MAAVGADSREWEVLRCGATLLETFETMAWEYRVGVDPVLRGFSFPCGRLLDHRPEVWYRRTPEPADFDWWIVGPYNLFMHGISLELSKYFHVISRVSS